MMRLELNSDKMIVDLAKGQALANDGDLTTAVVISLLTDRRADPDDELPEYVQETGPLPADRRGWAGDALPPVPDDRIGSRLWLLACAKKTEETRQKAIEYSYEALQWLIDDGHVFKIDITAEWVALQRLDLTIRLTTFETAFNVSVPVSIGGGAYVV